MIILGKRDVHPENLDTDGTLIIGGSGRFRLLKWEWQCYEWSRFNYTTGNFNTRVKGVASITKTSWVRAFSPLKTHSLNGSTVGNSFIRVDLLVKFLSVKKNSRSNSWTFGIRENHQQGQCDPTVFFFHPASLGLFNWRDTLGETGPCSFLQRRHE